MDTFTSRVLGDTVVAAVLASLYAASVGVAIHVEGPLGEGFLTGYVTIGGWLIWVPVWAGILRQRRVPDWPAAPFAASIPPYLLIGHLETERSYVAVMAAFAVAVTVLAAGWSWLARTISEP